MTYNEIEEQVLNVNLYRNGRTEIKIEYNEMLLKELKNNDLRTEISIALNRAAVAIAGNKRLPRVHKCT